MYKEEFKKLLQVIDDISHKMPELIYQNYWDKYESKYKYLFALYSESFKSAFSVCRILSDGCICQASVILRLLLESVSIINILSDYPELLDKYAKHYKIRLEVSMMDKEEEKEVLKKHFPNVPYDSLLSYMDYGWFESLTTNKICEKEMIRLAKLDDLIWWKEGIFDKIAHQSYTMETMVNEKDGDIHFVNSAIEILCKLFDYLCVNFHNLTHYDFVVDGIDEFNSIFRNIYKDLDFHN